MSTIERRAPSGNPVARGLAGLARRWETTARHAAQLGILTGRIVAAIVSGKVAWRSLVAQMRGVNELVADIRADPKKYINLSVF